MREMKFRAWAVNEKRFLDEDELHEVMPFFSGYELLGQDPHTFVLMDNSCDPGDDGIEKITEIKWLQFTGLKDKNGKEIFEGDVLKQFPGFGCEWEERTGTVKCQDASFWFWFNMGAQAFVLDDHDCQFEVLGSIYENPGLLQGEFDGR